MGIQAPLWNPKSGNPQLSPRDWEPPEVSTCSVRSGLETAFSLSLSALWLSLPSPPHWAGGRHSHSSQIHRSQSSCKQIPNGRSLGLAPNTWKKAGCSFQLRSGVYLWPRWLSPGNAVLQWDEDAGCANGFQMRGSGRALGHLWYIHVRNWRLLEFKMNLGEPPSQISHFLKKESEAPRREMLAWAYKTCKFQSKDYLEVFLFYHSFIHLIMTYGLSACWKYNCVPTRQDLYLLGVYRCGGKILQTHIKL